ncbi:hypothetical protein Ahy_A09g044201 isoform B [Arachis hypogaea]|nr:hypothetical protein Ahy_A09g044201 isoform B [Arachis hypogaea]
MTKRMDGFQLALVNTTNQPSLEWSQGEGITVEQPQEQVQYMQNTSNSHDEFHGDTYNPSWKNHPNLKWGENHWQKNSNHNQNRHTSNQNHHANNTNQYRKPQNTYQPPHHNSQTHQNNFSAPSSNSQNYYTNPPNNFQQQSTPIIPPIDHHETRISSLEATLQALAQTTQALAKGYKEHEVIMKNIERQVGQLAKQAERPTNVLPSDTIPNPRDTEKAIKWEECKAITLRSGKKVETEAITQEEHIKEGLIEEVKEQKQEQETYTQSDKLAKKEVVKAYQPMLPYPQRFKEENKEKQYSKFLEIFKTLHINIPFIEALEQMPLYAKFMKELLTKKRSLKEGQTVMMTRECSAIIQKKLPKKMKDPGSFHIPCTIGNMMIERAFCDLGASINLMPLSLMRKLQIHELKPTKIALQMADKSIQQALGVVENVLVKVDKFFLPVDFVILDIEEDDNTPIILGRPFLATARALIDVEKGELMLRVHDEHIVFHVFKNLQDSTQEEECMKIDSIDPNLKEAPDEALPSSCWKENEEVEVLQQAQRIEEKLQSKSAFKIHSKDRPKIETPKPGLSPRKEESPKKKMPRGWRNKKISTEDFSPGDKVMLTYQPIETSPHFSGYYTVNKILSLEHVEIIKNDTGRKLTVRGEGLRHYDHHPP